MIPVGLYLARQESSVEPEHGVGGDDASTLAALVGKHDRLSVIYETADPGKFPDEVQEAIGIVPGVPEGIARQAKLKERIFTVDDPPFIREDGSLTMSEAQYDTAKAIIQHRIGLV